jgi:hypothetical protein
MAKEVRQGDSSGSAVVQGPPQAFASVPPPDLYATSDIRFVMVEIGKLTVRVDRLIDDVKGHGSKIDKLRLTVSWVAGATAVVVILLGIAAKIVPLPHLDFSHSQVALPPAAKP